MDSCAKDMKLNIFLVALNQLGEDLDTIEILLQFGKTFWLYKCLTFKP